MRNIIFNAKHKHPRCKHPMKQVEHSYMGDVMIQVWMKFIKTEFSECTKQENFQGSHKLL